VAEGYAPVKAGYPDHQPLTAYPVTRPGLVVLCRSRTCPSPLRPRPHRGV